MPDKSCYLVFTPKKMPNLVPHSEVIASASNNTEMVALWLHSKAENSQQSYRRDIEHFLAHVGNQPLQNTTLNQLQSYHVALKEKGYAPRSIKRKLAAVKSLLSFSQKVGLTTVNAGTALQAPQHKNNLAERILTESEVLRIIDHASSKRNHILILFVYATGARVSEVSALKWRDIKKIGDRAQVTIYGKGDKTRIVTFSPGVWQELKSLRGDSGVNDAVFASRKGKGHLDTSQINRIVGTAAKKAGLKGKVSPHWLRHSHASHFLQRGGNIVLLQRTLGHSSLDTTTGYIHCHPSDSSALHLIV